jgi:hypothetical protein
MNRRQALFALPLLAGSSLGGVGCISQEAIRRVEAESGPEGTGIQFTGLPKVIKILATYDASPSQVAVAKEHAHVAQSKRLGRKHSDSGPLPAEVAEHSAAPGARSNENTPASKTDGGDLKTKIIAVDTVSDARLQGQHVIMLWNTQTQEVVGNQVYDVQSVPKRGEVAVWGNITAQYVGDGKL